MKLSDRHFYQPGIFKDMSLDSRNLLKPNFAHITVWSGKDYRVFKPITLGSEKAPRMYGGCDEELLLQTEEAVRSRSGLQLPGSSDWRQV